MLEKIIDFDKRIFLIINSLHNSFFDGVMWGVSETYTWLPFFLVVLYMIYKKYGIKSFLIIGVLIATISIADLTSVYAFKNVFLRLRPCHDESIAEVVHIVKNHCGGKYGFVSSHAANFFSLTVFSSLVLKQRYFTIISLSVATLIAYSRVYLGVHFPFDILGGAILGSLFAFVSYYSLKFFKKI